MVLLAEMQEFNPMGILVRTTGAIDFLPAEKCHAQSSKVFLVNVVSAQLEFFTQEVGNERNL